MAEYIEREALLKWALDSMDAQRDMAGKAYCAEFARAIRQFRAADVSPVVRGEWKPYRDYFSKRHIGWICTNCSGVQMDLSNGDTNYCPNCGCLMGGGSE